MKLFKIVTNQDQLHKPCKEVTFPLDENTKTTLLEMLDYLKCSQDDELASKYNIRPGVGIAANQIGVDKRMLAVYLVDEKGREIKYCLINPVISAYSVQEAYLGNGEGCLSVPKDVPGYVYRHNKVTIKAYDLLQEKDIVIKARGYQAIVLQHEIDHLNGILYIDRINKTNPFIEKENAICY